MGLNIKAVSERTGIPLHTLRAWERRYGVPRPQRVPGNRYRLYDESDIADILWMKRQVEAGVAPAQASAMLRELRQREVQMPAPTPLVSELQRALYAALVQGDEAAAQGALNHAWSAFASEQVLRDILQPTMRAIGEAWHRNTLSVEQEHFASNLVRQRLLAMIQAQPTPPLTAPLLVAACAPEEQHELGLLSIALLARRRGWNVTYLGQRTPLEDLFRGLKGAQFGAVSVNTANGLSSLIPIWLQLDDVPAPLFFGGELLNQQPQLRERLPGGFLGEDAVAAMQTLATSAPRRGAWAPDRRELDAALTLQSSKLQLAGETVNAIKAAARTEGAEGAGVARRYLDVLEQPTLFLIDVAASALAFDVPEMMDTQGRWLFGLLNPRGINGGMLRGYLDVFRRTAERILPADVFVRVARLTERLEGSVSETQK